MIRVLGSKRLMLLAGLAGLNLLLAAVTYIYLAPHAFSQQMRLNGLNGQISTVRSDIDRMQIEFEQLNAQQAQFDALKKKGFLSNQQRRQAEKVFESIQKQAGVISAVAKIEAGQVEDNEEAQKAEYKILSSPVKIHIEAMDGVDVFRYIYLLEHFFPGHVAVTDMQFERKSEVTGPVLRAIASGENPVLVDADIEMVWRTMIPQAEVAPAEPAGGGGG